MGKISEILCAVSGSGFQQGNVTSDKYSRSGPNSMSNEGKNVESCNSCRYINTICMAGLSVYLFSTVRKPLPDSTPFKRNARKLTGLVLSACFALTAIMRFAEIGPFQKKHTS